MDNSDNNKSDARKRREEEVHVLEGFVRLIRRHLETSETIREMAKDDASHGQDYLSERRILMQVNQLGLGQGVLVGVAVFALLRGAPHYLARRILVKPHQQQQQGGYKLLDPKVQGKNPFESSSAASAGNDRPPLPLRALRFGLDCIVSLIVAASTSLYFTDLNTVMDKVSRIPLVEGKSMVSQEFCTPMILEYQRIHQQDPNFWKGANLKYLQAIRTFCYNCRLRQAHEAQVRQERAQEMSLSSSSGRDRFPSIPPPGVNQDVKIDLDATSQTTSNEFGSDDMFENEFSSSSDYFGQQNDAFDEEWADSMVSSHDDNDKGGRGY